MTFDIAAPCPSGPFDCLSSVLGTPRSEFDKLQLGAERINAMTHRAARQELARYDSASYIVEERGEAGVEGIAAHELYFPEVHPHCGRGLALERLAAR